MDQPQPSYSRGAQDKALLAMTIGQAFDHTVAQYPQGEALVVRHQQRRYTWQQLAETVELHARAFLALGMQTGDRLGIWAPNCAEWCISQIASAKLGVILVNINPAYRSSELDYVLKQSGCQWLVCAGSFKTSDYHAMLQELNPRPARPDQPSPQPPAGFMPWSQLANLGAGVAPEQLHARQASLHFDQPVNIQYTSGTTGFPKGATLSHHNILNNGYMVGESLGLTAQDRLVIPVPLYHCFGMVMGNLGCITHGTTMIYPNDGFDPLLTLQRRRRRARHRACTACPPCSSPCSITRGRADFDLSSLRTGIMAGATCPIEVMRRVISELHMGEVQIAYGMTETSPVSLQTGADDDLERACHHGRPHPAATGKQDHRRRWQHRAARH